MITSINSLGGHPAQKPEIFALEVAKAYRDNGMGREFFLLTEALFVSHC